MCRVDLHQPRDRRLGGHHAAAIQKVLVEPWYLDAARAFYEKRYTGTPVVSPDFVKLADAYGIPALKVTQPSQVAEAFKTANETPGPFLIDFRVKEEVNVYPMIAPGAAVDEPIRRPKPMVVQG